MTDLIKLTKIKKNLYNNQYGESFLIYCKEDGTYDFLYENLIYSDQLDDRSFSFESEIDVVKFLETKDINQFQKETFNNLLVSFWTTTFISAEDLEQIKDFYKDKRKIKNINTEENNQLMFYFALSNEMHDLLIFMLNEKDLIKDYSLKEANLSFTNYESGNIFLNTLINGIKDKVIQGEDFLKMQNKLMTLHVKDYKKIDNNADFENKNIKNLIKVVEDSNYNEMIMKNSIKIIIHQNKLEMLMEIVNEEENNVNKQIPKKWIDTMNEILESYYLNVNSFVGKINTDKRKNLELIKNNLMIKLMYNTLNDDLEISKGNTQIKNKSRKI